MKVLILCMMIMMALPAQAEKPGQFQGQVIMVGTAAGMIMAGFTGWPVFAGALAVTGLAHIDAKPAPRNKHTRSGR